MTSSLLQWCVERDTVSPVEHSEKNRYTDFNPEEATRDSHVRTRSTKGLQSVAFEMAGAMKNKEQEPIQVGRAQDV